uniref:CX domain-containing protein n=1 Tax=Bursaphelenchus xylophilus TaxID=6326 RepID=A0A1I7SM97_BURXY
MTFNSGQGTELAAQHQSTGILYQGYEKDFHLCIFEEPNVQGRNERYEFRCDTSLECCGRVCCTPEVAAIPLWLWLLFLILGLLALLALLSLLAYWCARRKRKQKKDMTHGYRTIRQMDDDKSRYLGNDWDRDRAGYAEANDLNNKKVVGVEESDRRVALADRKNSFHEEETYEESINEEMEYGPGSDDEIELQSLKRTERGNSSYRIS